MNTTNTNFPRPSSVSAPDIESLGQRAADSAERVIAAGKSTTADMADSVLSGFDRLQERVPSALSRAAAQADALTRAGLERAREQGAAARERMLAAGDYTVRYVRDEPVKSMAIAAAAGLILGWLLSGRSSRRRSDY